MSVKLRERIVKFLNRDKSKKLISKLKACQKLLYYSFCTVAILIALYLLFFTSNLNALISVLVCISAVLFVRMVFKPTIGRSTLLMVSILPIIFFLNLEGHVENSQTESPENHASAKPANTNTESTFLFFSPNESIGTMSFQMVSNYLTKKNDWIAIIIALFSLLYAVYTWNAQHKTQQNTQRITPEIQKGILKDFYRHSYRNLIVLAAIRHKLEEEGFEKFYPADYHLLKLHTDVDSIYPETFVSNEDFCGWIHEFKLVVRNGNLEVDTIKDLLKSDHLSRDMKVKNIMMINGRINLIVERTTLLIKHLYKLSDDKLASEILEYLKSKPAQESTAKYQKRSIEINNLIKTEEPIKQHIYVQQSNRDDEKNDKIHAREFINTLFPESQSITGKRDTLMKEYPEYRCEQLDKLLWDKLSNEERQEIEERNCQINDFLNQINAEVFYMLPEIDLLPIEPSKC